MTKSSVSFGVRGRKVEALYERGQLHLGAIVYVKFSDSGQPLSFSSSRQDNAVRFAVKWISPSEWYVSLVERYEAPQRTTKLVHEYCGDHLDADRIDQAVSRLAGEIRIEYVYKTSELEKSFLSTISAVTERLDLCSRLRKPTVETELFVHHGPLLVYLYLTCFDLLGQSTTGWVNFADWLSSQRCAQEREDAVASLSDFTPVDSAKALLAIYQEKYGVKAAFFRFVSDVLPEEQRKILLDSIRITRAVNPPSLEGKGEGSEQEKLGFLYKIRNDYTHRARFVPAAGPGFVPMPDGARALHRQIFRADEWETIFVRGWPRVLEDCVRVGLAARLKEIAVQS